jgi:hypothetical protein
MSASLQTYRLALAVLWFAPCILLADGWSEVWPSQANPRQGYRQLSECYTAVVERCTAVSNTLPTAPAWYRSNRTILVDLKAKTKTCIPSFAATNLLDSASPFCATRAASSGSGFTIPTWSVTGLLVYLRMPTNYFDYTPYRSISGLGAGTNDTSVPYPHGFTNASTAAGGTNWPGSQTNWYSTDYGYAKLPDILNALRWTVGNASGSTLAQYEGATNDTAGWGDPVWQQLKTDASNQWAASVSTNAGWTAQSCANGGWIQLPAWMEARAVSQTWKIRTTGLATGLAHRVEHYVYTTNAAAYQGATPTFNSFDEGWVNGQYQYLSLSTAQTNATIDSATGGSTNIQNTWAARPTGSPAVTGIGYRHAGYKALVLWDVTGGFVFR